MLYAAREPFGFFGGDQTAYLEVGRGIADGDGYRSLVTGEPSAFWPPGYPLVVAAVALVVERGPVPGDLPVWMGVVQAVVGAATIVPVWWLARATTGRARAGTIAAALVALWPSLVLYTAAFHLETVFIAVLLGTLVLLARGSIPAGGLALGAAVLVRPFALPVVAIVAVARRSVRAAAVVAVLVLVVQVPWVVRNAIVLDAFVPSSTNAGDTLCIDHRDGGDGGFAFAPECFAGLDDVPPDRIEVERNERNLREAVDWVVENPGDEVRRWPDRAVELLRHDHAALDAVESEGHRPFIPVALRDALRIAADAFYMVVAPVGAVGGAWLLAARRRRTPATILVVGTAVTLLAVPVLLYGLTRFHVPALPLLAISAAALLDATREAARTRGRRAPARPAP